MILLSRPCIAFLALVLCCESSAWSAEVSCNRTHGDDWEQFGFKTDKLYPSGSRPTASTCRIGLVSGEITRGDYERVLSFYRLNHPFLERFLLRSPGGDVEDALNIGRLLRKYIIAATAPSRFVNDAGREFSGLGSFARTGSTFLCTGANCICASACALIWFGAPERGGTVGVHRPRTADLTFRQLGPAEAAVAYKQMLERIAEYLDEMEVPKSIIESMVSTGSAEIDWVEDESANRPPSFIEWVDASCGPFTVQEYKTKIELGVKKTYESTSFSKNDELLYDALDQKWWNRIRCQGSLVSTSRAKLTVP
jgi:hypothetical protein